jgi:hypothetical protein
LEAPDSIAFVTAERTMSRVAAGIDQPSFSTSSPSTSFMPTISAARASA